MNTKGDRPIYLVRRTILNQIINDCALINVGRGYNNTISSANIVKGIKSQSTIKSYPLLQIQMGSEKMDGLDESGSTIHRTSELLIAITVNTTDIDILETYIEDMKILFSYGTQSTITTSALFNVKYLDGYVLKEVIPFVENIKNLSTLYFILDVSYTDIVDD